MQELPVNAQRCGRQRHDLFGAVLYVPRAPDPTERHCDVGLEASGDGLSRFVGRGCHLVAISAKRTVKASIPSDALLLALYVPLSLAQIGGGILRLETGTP